MDRMSDIGHVVREKAGKDDFYFKTLIFCTVYTISYKMKMPRDSSFDYCMKVVGSFCQSMIM